jgi:hypothetical protein
MAIYCENAENLDELGEVVRDVQVAYDEALCAPTLPRATGGRLGAGDGGPATPRVLSSGGRRARREAVVWHGLFFFIFLRDFRRFESFFAVFIYLFPF